MNHRSLRSDRVQYLSLVLPGMLIFTVGLIIPMFLALGYSLTSWNGMTVEKPFVGLQNYAAMLSDRYAGNAWWFTLRFTFWNTLVQNVAAILLAVALDSGIKAQKLMRTVFFVPCLISAVVVGFVWLKIYGNVLPALATSLGLKVNTMLFGKEETVLGGLVLANNWQWIGYWMLIYLAALQSIPHDLYEAARVDGANALRQFFSITLPMLAPALTICIVGITTGSLKVYDLLVSSTNGGPGRASTSIIYYTYSTAISGRQYGYGSSLTISVVLALLLVALLQVKVLKKREVQL
ncbi:MAG: sugar ABC transporter permease [Candidatus Limiplasma sp.]|nr:sugar ABC transporter permease [Candidatus Limiplasma sp.]